MDVFNIGDSILEMITEWLESGVDIFIQFIENILLNYDGLAGIALDAYNLFVWLSGLLLVVVCLGKVIAMLLSEAEGSTEANAWNIILDTVKAGLLLVLMPFVISVTMNIVKALSEFFFSDIGISLKESINTLIESDSFNEAFGGLMSNLLVWLFVLIVVALFVIKMFIAQANILILEVLSPMVAISIANDSFDFTETWARDLLSHAVTIVVSVISMALFTEAITANHDTIWSMLPAMVGSGALVISGPTLVKNIWFSSGAGRAGGNIIRMATLRR